MNKKDIAATEMLVHELLQFVAKATSSKYGVSQQEYDETKDRIDNVFEAWYNGANEIPKNNACEDALKILEEAEIKDIYFDNIGRVLMFKNNSDSWVKV